MNKQEALQKIKELQEYIEECDKIFPQAKNGQLYMHESGRVYMVCDKVQDDSFRLVIVSHGLDSGNMYGEDNGFCGNEEFFTYIGMAKDLLTVAKT